MDQITRLDGRFAQVGQGLWQGELAGMALHGVETKDAPRRSSTERLLYAFSRAFVTDAHAGPPLDDEGRMVYALLRNQVEQFRKARGPEAMKDYELMQKSLAELMEPVLAAMPLQERLEGLAPEQRLEGLTPEEIARTFDALTDEVREQIKRRMH